MNIIDKWLIRKSSLTNRLLIYLLFKKENDSFSCTLQLVLRVYYSSELIVMSYYCHANDASK